MYTTHDAIGPPFPAPPPVPIFPVETLTATGTDTIAELTSRQRAHLRSLAHHLKPILHVGTDGVTDAVVRSVEEAFNTRELLKVKVQEAAPIPVDEAARRIADRIENVRVPQTIGRTIVLYRPFPGDPGIQLPT